MRKYYIDYLRVLGIIAVITIHVSGIFYKMPDTLGTASWWLADSLNAISRFCVPLFVMISGALLLGKSIAPIDFLRKRSLRLLPPLLFWSLIYLTFITYIQGETNTLVWYITTGWFINGQVYYHLWYISMFLCLMLFAPFINMFIMGDKPTPQNLLLFLIICFIFLVMNQASIFAQVLDIKIDWFKSFPWYISYFIAGYYIDKYADKIKISNPLLLSLILFLTLLGIFLNYVLASKFGVFQDNFALPNTGPAVFLITLSIFTLARKNMHKLADNNYISKISDATFGIYLIHPIFIYMFKTSIPAYSQYPLISMPLMIFIIFVISFICIVYMRKIKILKQLC